MFERQWLYRDGEGATQGPIPDAELRELVQAGNLNADSNVRVYGPDGFWGTLAGIAPELVGVSAEDAAARRNVWRATPPRPWRRYLARLLDYLVLGSIVMIVPGVVLALISENIFYEFFHILSPQYWFGAWNTFFSVLFTTPVIAVLVGLTGYTPGKWIFGVRVVDADDRPIGVLAGFKRELTLWVTGLAAGLPLISYLAAIFAYRQLVGVTPALWDRQVNAKVVYRPAGRRQTMFLVLGLAIIAFVRLLAIVPAGR